MVSFGSHIPVLVDVFSRSTGPVAELGMGDTSTPLLFWLCKAYNREFISFENNREWLEKYKKYPHKKVFVNDWDEVDGKYGMVLIDQKPPLSRSESARRLQDSDFLILHDSEDPQYGYEEIYPLFTYRYDFTFSKRHTTVLSNEYNYPLLYEL